MIAIRSTIDTLTPVSNTVTPHAANRGTYKMSPSKPCLITGDDMQTTSDVATYSESLGQATELQAAEYDQAIDDRVSEESMIWRGWYSKLKVAAEFVIATALLIPAMPLIVLSIALVKLSSPGPAIYAQRRIGQHGRIFVLYKIRTMLHDCERLSGPQWSTNGDSRITPVGRFLRRTHLDELPQLINILRGEMSLIGPRPERPEFVTQLERAIPHYRDRLLIRPGLTGLAQVQLPPDSDLDGVRRKLACDLYYVRWYRPSLDVRIVFATALKDFGCPMKVGCRLCRIPSGQIVEWTYDRWESQPQFQTA
jgi:lipopolysaccharide/colanic/teichoic acid biosynthesis glycosyltransferase